MTTSSRAVASPGILQQFSFWQVVMHLSPILSATPPLVASPAISGIHPDQNPNGVPSYQPRASESQSVALGNAPFKKHPSPHPMGRGAGEWGLSRFDSTELSSSHPRLHGYGSAELQGGACYGRHLAAPHHPLLGHSFQHFSLSVFSFLPGSKFDVGSWMFEVRFFGPAH
jgi:hypothetical protein